MKKLTPWFNAKSHPPSREGWYECKECKTRHYFRHGLWYREKKSLKLGASMYINLMHWRGLTRESLASQLARYEPEAHRSDEETAWLNMVPVGMEFGSPDFESLMLESVRDLKEEKVTPDEFGKGVPPASKYFSPQ